MSPSQLTAPLRPPAPEPEGFGGWLLLPAAALLLGPPCLLAGAVATMHRLLAPGGWARIASPGAPDYHPLLPALLHFQILAGLVGFAVGVWAAVSFFRRHRAAPGRVLAFAGLVLGLQVIDALWTAQMPSSPEAGAGAWRAAGPFALLCALGLPYFMVSRRVANTFDR